MRYRWVVVIDYHLSDRLAAASDREFTERLSHNRNIALLEYPKTGEEVLKQN